MMLNVGLIGLGPEWERRYFPALVRLRHRLRVRRFYGPLITQADQVPAEFDGESRQALVAWMDGEDVRPFWFSMRRGMRAFPRDLPARRESPRFWRAG